MRILKPEIEVKAQLSDLSPEEAVQVSMILESLAETPSAEWADMGKFKKDRQAVVIRFRSLDSYEEFKQLMF
jgi:hypothetical protein